MTETHEKEIARTDAALWSRFFNAESSDEYFKSWLALQCSLIPNAIQGVLIIGGKEGDNYIPVAKWPEKEVNLGRLANICERVLEADCGLLEELDGRPSGNQQPSLHYAAAYPVHVEKELSGVVALEVSAVTEDQLKATMVHLQWGVSWVELFLCRQQAHEVEHALTRVRSSVDILAGVLGEDHFDRASMAFVTELATRFDCDRVGLGTLQRGRIHVKAVSHSAKISRRMNLVRALERAMEEAYVQRREIVFPEPEEGGGIIVREHADLSALSGSGAVLSVPFYGKGGYSGVLTLERPAGKLFACQEVELCRSICGLTGPALESKRLNDRLLAMKVVDSAAGQLERLFGPRYLVRKIAVALVAAGLLFFSVATGEYWLSADTALEPAVRRVVAAPFNGYLNLADNRAGDLVEKGQLLCALDDRDLRLERLNWASQRTKFQRQYQEAFAEHDRATVKIISAQLDQAEAQLNLAESRLDRTRITAPFDGILVSGDLTQRLGGPVQEGEVLFEIAPLDAYRVILKVDERRIADVQVGQSGKLILSSLPEDKFPFRIEKITPISSSEEGRNYFRVEAALDRVSDRLRPGMEGIGKTFIDRRKLISIWGRNLMEWLRLWAWSWWP